MNAGVSKRIEGLGKCCAEGIKKGIKDVEKEGISNNSLKMAGKPMKRKKGRKDKRGKIRKQVIRMNMFLRRWTGTSAERR